MSLGYIKFEEIAQRQRALAALPKGSGSISSAPMVVHNYP